MVKFVKRIKQTALLLATISILLELYYVRYKHFVFHYTCPTILVRRQLVKFFYPELTNLSYFFSYLLFGHNLNQVFLKQTDVQNIL